MAEIVHEANKYVQLHVNKRAEQLRKLSSCQHSLGTIFDIRVDTMGSTHLTKTFSGLKELTV